MPPSRPGARLAIPWRADFSALAYVLAGTGSAGNAGRPVGAGQLAVFGDGDAVTVTVSRITEAMMEEVRAWQSRPLDPA